jgi:tetratricopeptide (TPR) repeat protein
MHPHLVTVLGEAGIGKSRLVAEFEGSLPNEARILHGRCLPYGEALGYWALASVVKEAAAITVADGVETASRKLGEMVAEVMSQAEAEWDPREITHHLALLSGLEVESDRPATPIDQRILHVSVCRFIEALAAGRLLCIVFEDLHWAGDALLDLIEFIAKHVYEAPLLIVVQARPELLEKRPTWCRGIRNFTSLSLESLDDHHGRDLALVLCQERGLSIEVADQVAHGAAGNPLFAEELVATFVERGGIRGVPSAIKALISTRLDRLPPQERRAIQLAAVIGKIFWEGGLRALGAAGDITEHLEALQQKALLRNHFHSQMHGDREYAFKHDLIRDVAYETLSRADRRWLHSRIVDWIEQISGERVEEYLDLLAYHAVQAGLHERAIDYLIRAAARADRAAAHREEAALLAQAIEIAERTGRQQVIAELHAKRGRSYRAVAQWTEADHELKTALPDLAPQQYEQRLQVLIDLAEVRYWLSDTPSTRQYATEALRLAEQVGRDEFAASAMGALAIAEASDGVVHASLDQYQRALVRAGKNLLPPLYWFEQYGLTLYWTGNYEAAIERSQQAIESAWKSHDTTTIARALGNLGMALTGRGRYDEALQAFSEARQFAREYGTETWLARATAMCGGLHLAVFDFARAEELAQEAREMSRSLNWPQATASGGIDLLLNYARRQEVGRTESLLVEVAEAVAGTKGVHGWNWALRLAETRAEIALARGEWEEAVGFADDAIEQSLLRGRVKYQTTGLETRAKALTSLGRKHEAIASLGSAVELARPVGDPAMFLRAAVALLTLEGDDALLAEARTTALRIIGALRDEKIIRCFTAAEQVRVLGPLNRGTAGYPDEP